MTFRTDIEGLRGVAILLVVGFHAGVAALAGAFVGVDVFLVLSGYFITAMIARELADTGTVDLTDFWGRRAVRLLPTLIVVLLATVAMVMLLYAPIDRAPVAEDVRAVALYSGNLEFARSSVNYFREGTNPLLHTWSLAVEEQFYLLWPLLFVLVGMIYAHKSIGDPDTEAASRKRMLVVIAVAGIASFIASVAMSSRQPAWAFFAMPYRIWEFALGAMLALYTAERTYAIDGRATLLQVAGIAALAIAVLTYDAGTTYPGIAALLPAFAAAALIVGGERSPDSGVSRALSASWLRWLGRHSYAWYLWHWPLVSLAETLNPDATAATKLSWSAAALVLAWLTHKVIEEPSRNGALSRVPRRWLLPAALGVSVAAAGVGQIALGIAKRQATSPQQKPFASARSDRNQHGCWGETARDAMRDCVFGDPRGRVTLALLGDSHAEHWLGALDRAGKERGWRIMAFVRGGCPVPTMPELKTGKQARFFRECEDFREIALGRIEAMRPDIVILSSWDHYVKVGRKSQLRAVDPALWERGLRRTYARLSEAGLKTTVIRGTPRTWFDVPTCQSRRAARLPFARDCQYDRARGLMNSARASQDRAATGLPIRFIDMNDQICATARCATMRDGIVMFTDDNHLTATFSASLGGVLGERIGGQVDSW